MPGFAIISAASTAIVLLCTALFILLTRRHQLGQLLRVGDE